MKRFPLSKFTFLLVPLLSLAIMTAHVSAATSWTYTWKIVKSPNGALDNSELTGIAALSQKNVWSVGWSRTGPNGPPVQGLIEHWNGSTWSIVPSPNPGSNYNFNLVSASSATDIWANGNTLTGNFDSPSKTLLEHWNGTTWSIVPSPNPGLTHNVLGGLVAISKNDAWTEGSYDTSAGSIFHTLIEHWNGSQWSVVKSPSPGTNDFLNDLSAVSASDVWSVGNSTINGVAQTLIEHWNGSQWSMVPSPNVGTHDNFLIGVTTVSTNDVWTVGAYNDTNNILNTLIEHWDGSRWSVVPSPNVGTFGSLTDSLAAVSANDIWTVGFYNTSQNQQQNLVEHWNGTRWSVVQVPNTGAGGDGFNHIGIISANDMWAVGNYVTGSGLAKTLIEHCC